MVYVFVCVCVSVRSLGGIFKNLGFLSSKKNRLINLTHFQSSAKRCQMMRSSA